MLGWSLRFPVGEGREAVWNGVGETARKVLEPLAWAFSMELTEKDRPEGKGLTIRNGEPTKTDREGMALLWGTKDKTALLYAKSLDGPLTLEIDPDRFPAGDLPFKWLKFLFYAGLFPLWRSGSIAIHHGGLIARDGRGILIAGPSGMGKSTLCADVAPEWETLADDMVLCYRKGDRLCARPLPTWSLWFAPGKSPRPFQPAREVTLDLALMLGRGEPGFESLSERERKLALSESFGYFIPLWRLNPEIQWLRKEIFNGVVPVLDDFSRNLPAFFFHRPLSEDPRPWLERILRVVEESHFD